MTTLREAAQQALEALQAYGSHAPNCDHLVLLTSLPPQRKPCSCGLSANITALKAALAEPQSTHSADCYQWHHDCAVAEVERLRAVLAQRKPLTEEEIKACEQQAMVNGALPFEQRVFFARAIERVHGIGTEARATLSSPRGSLGEEV